MGRLVRRIHHLSLAGILLAGALLASCAPAARQAPRKETSPQRFESRMRAAFGKRLIAARLSTDATVAAGLVQLGAVGVDAKEPYVVLQALADLSPSRPVLKSIILSPAADGTGVRYSHYWNRSKVQQAVEWGWQPAQTVFVLRARSARPVFDEAGYGSWADTRWIRGADASFARRVIEGEATATLP